MKTKEKSYIKIIALFLICILVLLNILPIVSYANNILEANGMVEVSLTSTSTRFKSRGYSLC